MESSGFKWELVKLESRVWRGSYNRDTFHHSYSVVVPTIPAGGIWNFGFRGFGILDFDFPRFRIRDFTFGGL